MRDDELEQELRPVRAVDLGGPGRQRMALQPSDQRAFAERPVDDDAMPRSRASGRMRCSTSRSSTL